MSKETSVLKLRYGLLKSMCLVVGFACAVIGPVEGLAQKGSGASEQNKNKDKEIDKTEKNENVKKIKCPVCAQIMESKIKICPNDGTNLTLEGQKIHVEKSVSDDDAKDSELVAVGKETQKNKDKSDILNKTDNKKQGGKYTRHDMGGERQRDTAEDKDQKYSERDRRIGDKRGEVVVKTKPKDDNKGELRSFSVNDHASRALFEEKRKQQVRGRYIRQYEERAAKQGLAELRRRSLWNQGAPFTSVGFRASWMREGNQGGPVVGSEIDINFVKTSWRVGLSSMIGSRLLEEHSDVVFIQHVNVGFQKPWRFSPYILGKIGIGALFSNRFNEELTYLVRDIGVEAGLDCRVLKRLVFTPSMGFVRYAIDDVYWNSFTVKVAVGF